MFKIRAHATTHFDAVKNLDRINLRVGELVSVEGIYYRDGDKEHYDAQVIHELVNYLDHHLKRKKFRTFVT